MKQKMIRLVVALSLTLLGVGLAESSGAGLPGGGSHLDATCFWLKACS